MSTPRAAFWRGARDSAPFTLVIAPFGMLFGVVATEAGLDLIQTMSMTVLIIAGAAQFTALSMLQDNAPVLVAVAAGLAVNLRMAMYSASLAPHFQGQPLWKRALASYFLFDQTYGVSINRYGADPQMNPAQKLAYFLGTASLVGPLWYAATLTGALAGKAVPEGLALDFALPITFIALIAPGLRSLAHVVAALVSIIGALALSFLPFNTGLMIAALLALLTGAETERRMNLSRWQG
jgi:4-azaleucine resistance transporter AzlC